MTWGSNPSYGLFPCRFCGRACVDDRDSGLSSHELSCPDRRIAPYGTGIAAAMILGTILWILLLAFCVF